MVARHEDDLAAGSQPRPDRPQHRRRDGPHLAGADLEQLDDVAQEHEPVDAVQRVQERGQRLGAAQDVTAQPRAEVEVRDDERAHGGAAQGLPDCRRSQSPSASPTSLIDWPTVPMASWTRPA